MIDFHCGFSNSYVSSLQGINFRPFQPWQSKKLGFSQLEASIKKETSQLETSMEFRKFPSYPCEFLGRSTLIQAGLPLTYRISNLSAPLKGPPSKRSPGRVPKTLDGLGWARLHSYGINMSQWPIYR